ncbi:RHS repeat-associated core domain-containing protein, partial [Dubosiella newyorkensis]|uniref:RHS repeat-associated core domain-containing protein n=1 Tax=Dubosiella newyorkensis TaxID=1862672 RepID=UPI0025AB929C
MERTITESFGYYPDGRLKSATAGGMRYDYAYDAAGRLKTKRASGVSLLSYEYDLNGNLMGMTDVTGKHTAYRYNSLNQLEEITDSGRSLARYSYNADGTIKRLEVGNSLVTEYGYDADRNITSQKTVMTGMPEHGIKGLPAIPKTGMDPVAMVDNTYTYDGNANRITKNTLSGKTGFGYDSANRLVRAEYSQFSEEYRYDRAGNRTSRHRTSKGNAERREETYSYDACNRLTVHDITGFRDDGTQESTRRLYTYDMQGNMLSDGDRQYSYDVRNRLAEVRTADGSWQKNHYDGEGLRAELEENGRLVRFIYDGDKAVLEGTDENTIRHIRGYELVSSDSEAAKTYYHYASDELGSITHVTDEDGNVLNRYEYDAFGNFTLKEETVENRFGFAGEQYDPAANLYYLRARFYNPVIGRFIQEDTYYGDGLNLYTYCHNNPVGYIDPSGHTTWDCPNKQTAIQYLTDNGMSEQEARNKYDEIRKKSGSAEEARKRITGEYTDPGDRTRLPRNNGHWEGEAGNGIWHSDIEEVNAITGG